MDMEPIQSNPIQTEDAEARSRRIQARRAAYAARILALAGISTETDLGSRIAAAFRTIPREKFVGQPPWTLLSGANHIQAITDESDELYQDDLLPLGVGRGLNNGQPSLHAMCLAALAPAVGERVVHVGAGTGYYTAMLAMLVGANGRVDAYEIEPELARRARENLAEFPQVKVYCRSGAEGPLPECDMLYVSASAPEPLAVWLDALRPGGRLLFPLAPRGGTGEILLVTRKADGTYPARFLCGVQFVSCARAQNAQADRALDEAFLKRRWSTVRGLHRDDRPDESCWCAGRGWWLSTQE
jgi:protein-L-isoaspartate(D-aspartate) O-methyltransferase